MNSKYKGLLRALVVLLILTAAFSVAGVEYKEVAHLFAQAAVVIFALCVANALEPE